MKKLVLALFAAALFSGCAAIEKSEFLKHDTMYRDGSHLWYSWYGYLYTDEKEIQKSREGNWWGEVVEIQNSRLASTKKQ